jgi:hypothetical protein
VVQPLAEDLHWIQIEDFVDIFNRLFYIYDESSNSKFKSCRYQSAWHPESSGPLLIDQTLSSNIDPSIAEASRVKAKLTKLARKPFLVGPKPVAPSARSSEQGIYSFHGGVETIPKRDSIDDTDHLSAEGTARSSYDRRSSVESTHHSVDNEISTRRSSLKYQRADEFLDSVANQEESKSFGPSGRSSHHGSCEESSVSSIHKEGSLALAINPNFEKNPRFVLNVSEFTTLCIHVYQLDHRWSRPRPFQAHHQDNRPLSYRDRILIAAMSYDDAIGFVVKKLPSSSSSMSAAFDANENNGKAVDVLVGGSQLEFSGSVSAAISLAAGRYAVIPFTHRILPSSKDFMIHFHYIEGYVDLEGPHESSEVADATILTSEHALEIESFPKIESLEEWEHFESNDESSVKSLYEEIGSISQSIVAMSQEMDEMKLKLQRYQDQSNNNNITSPSSNDNRKTDHRSALSPRFRSPKSRNREAAFIASKLSP